MKSILLFLLIFGCNCLYTQSTTPPTTGLYFRLNGVIHLAGDSVLITDIGSNATLDDASSTLVCVTSNVNTKCCRTSDGGSVGEWYYPNGTMVPRKLAAPAGDILTRTGFAQQVRLNRRANAVGPLGVYRCDVPADPSGAIISASITIQDQVATEASQEDKSSNGVQSAYVVAVVIVVLVVVIVLIIIALIVIFIVVRERSFKLNPKKECNVGAIPLSDVGTVKDSTPEYEDIENYQPQDPPVPTSQHDDIRTVTCPAYLPTTRQTGTPNNADYDQVCII